MQHIPVGRRAATDSFVHMMQPPVPLTHPTPSNKHKHTAESVLRTPAYPPFPFFTFLAQSLTAQQGTAQPSRAQSPSPPRINRPHPLPSTLSHPTPPRTHLTLANTSANSQLLILHTSNFSPLPSFPLFFLSLLFLSPPSSRPPRVTSMPPKRRAHTREAQRNDSEDKDKEEGEQEHDEDGMSGYGGASAAKKPRIGVGTGRKGRNSRGAGAGAGEDGLGLGKFFSFPCLAWDLGFGIWMSGRGVVLRGALPWSPSSQP